MIILRRASAEGSGSPTTPLEARHLLARQNPSNVLKLINGKITHRLKRNSVIQIKFHIELLSHILAAQNISLRQTDDFLEGNSTLSAEQYTANALEIQSIQILRIKFPHR
ncbi:hypothetical protein [Burkholderia ambifaria]|uniref:hypothetical protein n=1 Tax=Burkholderia ambifaria TaxID=152480 RepID=UPI00158E8CFA|nr:hypothetical protein [Burkholderia ambifaria]MBR8347522.1 hypothetical protein [Burkholderia ambifaria]